MGWPCTLRPMSNAVATSPAPDVAPTTSVGLPALLPLTDKQEAFCLAFLEHGNLSLAYRSAFEVVTKNRHTVHVDASRLAQLPQVSYRIAQLKEAAASRSVASKAQLIDFLWRRIRADRAALITHVQLCCRHCYGSGHKFQWVDDLEYATAYAQWMTRGQKDENGNSCNPPDYEGGFGFDPHLPPAATCTAVPCLGFGQGRTVITDTTTLTGDVALIYEGVKETDKGIEIKVADRNADIALFLKLTGYGTDELEGMLRGAAAGGAAGAVAAQAVVEKVKTMNSDDTRRAYLTMIGGA